MLVIIFAVDEIIKDAKASALTIISTVEQTLSNEITIFDNQFAFAQISNVMTFYLKI